MILRALDEDLRSVPAGTVTTVAIAKCGRCGETAGCVASGGSPRDVRVHFLDRGWRGARRGDGLFETVTWFCGGCREGDSPLPGLVDAEAQI